MKIQKLFKRPSDLYIAISAENVERRDAEPFYSFDTDVPKVQPLWDVKESGFEIYERTIGEKEEATREMRDVISKMYDETQDITEEDHEIDYEEFAVEYEAEPTIEFKLGEPKVLLLPMGESVKLLTAGKQPLLLMAPDRLEQVVAEIVEGQIETESGLPEILEAQHVVYFSDIEYRDGAETIVEDRIIREKHGNFFGAKIVGALLMLIMGAVALFPPISLNAAKVEYNVNPTNTTPGLSFSIASNDLAMNNNQGSLLIQTQTNQLATSTLDLDVSTTGADGYKMYVTTSGTDKVGDYTNALVNKDIAGSDGKGVKIQSLASDSTQAAFPAGYWGYTTTSAASIQNSTVFKPFPIYDDSDGVKRGGSEIASVNTAVADSDAVGETPFTIGIKTDNSLPAGKYENELLFTVIANPVTVTYNLSFDGNTDDASLAGVPATVTEASADVFRGVTIPADKPTRDEFIFAGWAESANGPVVYNPGDSVTMQVTNVNDSQTVNKTLYAVWTQKEWMQDFDEENELLNTGDNKMLYDKRDSKAYTVKRLADGSVWMTKNLGYETGAYAVSNNAEYGGYYSWSAAQSICPAGWHLPTTSSTGEFVDLYDAYNSEAAMLGTDGPHFVQAGIYRSGTLIGEGEDGRYWSANRANITTGYDLAIYSGTVQVAKTDDLNENFLSVRCIAGEKQAKYMQNFNDAIDLRTVGDSDTYYDKRDKSTYTVKRLADGKVWMTQNLRYIGTDSDPGTTASTAGRSFTTTADLSEGNATLTTTDGFPFGTPQLLVKYNGNTTYGAYYDWQAAKTVCPSGWHLPSQAEYLNLATYYNTSAKMMDTNGPAFINAGDYNGGNSTLRETQNGYYWTTDAGNGSTTGAAPVIGASTFYINYNGQYRTTGSSVRCVGDQPNVFFMQDFDERTMLPNTNDTAALTDKRDGSVYTVRRLPDGKVWMVKNLAYALDARAVSATYGGYYTWDAAQSVCPAGWHLPSNGVDGDYGVLGVKDYGATYVTNVNGQVYSSNYRAKIVGANTDTDFLIGGFYQVDGSLDFVGTVGAYWTSLDDKEYNGERYGNNFWINSNYVYVGDWSPKGRAMSVRCIADEDARVTFNANGGTGTMATQSLTKGMRQTLTANTFTREGYNFMGWALSANATTAKYADGQSVVFNKATTLYAVWEANYMQDFDAKTQIPNTGDAMILVDSRDGNTYTVKRLADGKVWMTQNLAYATGATIAPNARGGYYSWSAAQNACPTGWHLPASSEYAGMYDNYSSVATFTTDGPELGFDGRWMISSNSYQYVDSAGYYWNSTNADEAFSFNNNGQVWLTYTYLSTSYSNQVRCIANEQETVSFNANGGTDTMADVTVEKGNSVTLTNEFANPAYNFIGWATSADGEKAYDDGATITLTENLTLYALWEPKGEFMQDFDQDTEILTTGSSKTLYDERDGNTYIVRRLDDGKVWMTQDLGFTDDGKYKTGNFGAYYNWDDALTVCPVGWHIIDKEEVKALDLAWGGTGEGRAAANTATNFISMNQLNLTYSGRYFGNPTKTLQRVGLEAIYWTGNEYATDSTAGNNLLLKSSGNLDFYDTSKSNKTYYEQPVRCIADYEEATVTFNANNGTGTVPSAIKTVVGQSIEIPTSSLTRSGYNFLGWATNSSATAAEYVAGDTLAVTENVTLYAVWENTFYSITTMQEMTTDVCNRVATPSKTATNTDSTGEHIGDTNYIPQTTLRDTRDNNTYVVRKLADGNCWMAEDMKAQGVKLTAAESDNLTADFTLPASNGSWQKDGVTTPRTFIDTLTGSTVLYSWYAATAGTNRTLTGAGVTPGSICPKGWELPRDSGNKSFQNMIGTIYGGASNVNVMRSWPISIPAMGMMIPTYTTTGGWGNNYSIHYTAGAVDTNTPYVSIGASGRTDLRYAHTAPHVGFAVRCVAK